MIACFPALFLSRLIAIMIFDLISKIEHPKTIQCQCAELFNDK